MPLIEGPKEWYVQICEKKVADQAQRVELLLLVHFQRSGDAHSRAEIHQTAGLWPKTAVTCDIAKSLPIHSGMHNAHWKLLLRKEVESCASWSKSPYL